MFKYKNHLTLNQKFNKSVNIVYDKNDCEGYVVTRQTINFFKILFNEKNNNSISVIGPFGSGKSSLMLFTNTILSDDKYSKKCLNKLKSSNLLMYSQIENYKKNKKFYIIKMTGEYLSFRQKLKSTLLEYNDFKKTNEYLREKDEYQISNVLELLTEEILDLKYTNIIFSIDEFGKFLEYGIDNKNINDISELQTVAEFSNSKKNWKLIVALHKSFREYMAFDNISISFTEWDKIQGRFENIVFKDDYFEMLNIFKEAMVLNKKSKCIMEAQKIIEKIYKDDDFFNQNNFFDTVELFKNICPIHPYAVLIISEIFTKYFQNQRSVYSFLFSFEPKAFQEFIDCEIKKSELYGLSNLYDYLEYLLKIYTILLPDREVWYLSEYRLKDSRLKNNIQRNILKAVSLINAFKLNHSIVLNDKSIVLSLIDKYTKKDIELNIKYLKENNIIVFQEQSLRYSLLEDSNIDINKEVKKILSQNINIDYEKNINIFFEKKQIIAKRFFSDYGLEIKFQKEYITTSCDKFWLPYRVFLFTKYDSKMQNIISKNNKSIYILIKNKDKIEDIVKKIEIYFIIKNENKEKISFDTSEIINTMIFDHRSALENYIEQDIENGEMFFQNRSYKYSLKQLQKLLSEIAEKNFNKTPIINNYTLNHTINNKGTNTSIVKQLFLKMMSDYDKEDLSFEKFPAEKALYLSVIKPAGIHKKIDGKYQLCQPDSYNFQHVWEYISKTSLSRIQINSLVQKLSQEPFGLNETKAFFVISLFIIVEKDNINIFRDNTYTYDVGIDMLMNIWKASNKYELQLIKLNDIEKNLFSAYIKITSDTSDFTYTKEKITSITKILFTKFSMLPDFSKKTQILSIKAIALRSTLLSMKEPTKAYFEDIPKALGYDNIQNLNIEEYIESLKSTFNEIVLSYRKLVINLEKYIAEVFYLKSNFFPYENQLSDIGEKLIKQKGIQQKINAILRSFINSDSLISLLDSLSVVFLNKEIDKCDDKDIEIFKAEIKKNSIEILNILEIKNISKNKQNVRKIEISTIEEHFKRIISIDKQKVDTINKKVADIKKMIPSSYSLDEKLFLISQLLKEEIDDNY